MSPFVFFHGFTAEFVFRFLKKRSRSSIDEGDHTIDYRVPTIDYCVPTINERAPTIDYRVPTIDYCALTINERTPTIDYRVPTIDYCALTINERSMTVAEATGQLYHNKNTAPTHGRSHPIPPPKTGPYI